MEQEKLTVDDLFGDDKEKQAAAAFIVVQSLNGYDTTLFMTPQDKKPEIMKVLKTARQIVIINRNRGYIAALGNALNLFVSVTIANTFALFSLLSMKKEGTDAKLFVESLKGDFGLPDVAEIVNTDKDGKVVFEPDNVIIAKTKSFTAKYQESIPTAKATIQMVEEASKWEYFGKYIQPDLLENCEAIKELFSELYTVLNREIGVYNLCLEKNKNASKISPPDLMKPDRKEMKKWQDILKAVRV